MRKYLGDCLHGLLDGCVHAFKMHATKQLSICAVSISVGLLLLLSVKTREKFNTKHICHTATQMSRDIWLLVALLFPWAFIYTQ